MPKVERSLVQNLFHDKQLEYRNLPPVGVPRHEGLPEAAALGNGIAEQGRSESWESMSSSTKVRRKKWWEHRSRSLANGKLEGGFSRAVSLNLAARGDRFSDTVPGP